MDLAVRIQAVAVLHRRALTGRRVSKDEFLALALRNPVNAAIVDELHRLALFLTQNTQVGVRRASDGHEVYAPRGFDDIAALIARPNPGPNFSAANYEAKAKRWKALWPEITVIAAE